MAIEFREAMVGSMSWEIMPADLRMPPRRMRRSSIGWSTSSAARLSVETLPPDATRREPSAEERARCASALPTVDGGGGIRFVQEDNPHLIGAELAKWHAALL
jgi:hypothetical protein